MRSSPPPRLYLCVLLAALGFGSLNSWNAHHQFPHWAQDLAFFTQLVHSAASGGEWASPLLFEPAGFFEMVHTHLVLPLIVAAYWLVGSQDVLLFAQGAFTAAALIPAWQLGQQTGGRRHAWAAVIALLVFAPVQALGTADFRPSALFLPGLLGVFAAAHRRDLLGIALWAALANLGRQEAAFLLAPIGLTLLLCPFGASTSDSWFGRLRDAWRWREGIWILALAAAWAAFWYFAKPTLFFHVQPEAAASGWTELAPDIAENRIRFGLELLMSGAPLGVLSPAGLFAGIPVGWIMANNPREWGGMTGPSAHYHVFWLPFVLSACIAGSAKLGRLGSAVLVLGLALPFQWAVPRSGAAEAAALESYVRPKDHVAADDDVIHSYAGREVLWNTRQIEQPDREKPREWPASEWPIPLETLDVVVSRHNDPLVELAQQREWSTIAETETHVLLRRPQSEP